MLETMRKNSRNFLIYILFGILIAVFVINFGPGSRGCMPGEGGATYAAKVDGSTLSEQDFRFAYIALGGAQFPAALARERHLKELVMDKLIERELLAEQASKLGFSVSQKEVEDMIAAGRMIVMGIPRRVDSYVFKDGKFDYTRFKQVAQNELGVTVMRFIDIERRELLADKMRELLQVATKVSPNEVKAEFEEHGLQANLEFVRFSSRRYADEVQVTPAEIDAYVKAHAAALKKEYSERSFLYKDVGKQARLREIMIELAKDAPAAQVATAKKKITQAAAKIKGGTAFADVAKNYSTSVHAQKQGGELGWRKKGFTGYGDAIETKIFAAKKGDLIGPERTDRGFVLVQVEGERQGNIPEAEAEREIAETELRNERSLALAKSQADALLAQVKSGKKLEALLQKDSGDDAAKTDDTPKLEETGLFSRHGDMVQDIGVSKELAQKAFELKPGEVAGPFEVGTGYVIARVKEHKDPDMADFAKREPELTRDAERAKWAEVLDGWAKQRCVAARDAGHIQVNGEILTYEGETAAQKTTYQPCAGSRLF